jgi:NAD(P)-dependent dehydrogenase (short-subunit alcohol dehydrogenase family)
MSAGIAGRSALVTGGASGLGAAIAAALAEHGARVVVADVDSLGAERVAEDIRAAGGVAQAEKVDVTHDADVQRAVDAAAALGPVGIAVLGAAVETRAPLVECGDEDWQRVLDVNLKGPFLCMRRVIPRMVDAGGGAVIALGSTLGLIASAGYPAYAASKGALANLCKLVASEHAHQGVRVNLLAPGACDTGLFVRTVGADPQVRALVARSAPMRRLGTARDVCDAVLFLAGDEGRYISGAVLPVDGGAAARRAWLG